MRRLVHRCRRRLAIVLATVELHRMSHRESDGQILVAKRRSWLSRLLVPAGNLYLRLMGADSEVLSEEQWRRREQIVASAATRGDAIITPLLSGETLCSILRRRDLSEDQKTSAILLALRELRSMHASVFEADAGEERLFSHGDATAQNVCVDTSKESAAWFDFDTRHRQGISAVHRQADDLRALIFSSAACMPGEDFTKVASLCAGALCSSELIRGFLERLTSSWRKPNTFHLAQAPLSFSAYQDLRGKLTHALERRLCEL